MKQVFVFILIAAFCLGAAAQQKTGIEKSQTKSRTATISPGQQPVVLSQKDSLLIVEIANIYNQLASAIEMEFAKLLRELQENINQLNTSIENLNGANKLLENEIKKLKSQLASKRYRLDSLVNLYDNVSHNPFSPLFNQLPAMKVSVDSLHQLVQNTEIQIQTRDSKIAENKSAQKELQKKLIENQKEFESLEKEKQKLLSDIQKQKQLVIENAIKLANEQSINLIDLTNTAKKFSNSLLIDSLKTIKKRYIHK